MNVDLLHSKTQAVDPETGLLTRPFFRWLTQLYERTGGPYDDIASVDIRELSLIGLTDSKITEQEKEIAALDVELSSGRSSYFDLYTFPAKEISANYTTFRNEILICTSNITVTLNPYPKMGERVYIKRTNGKVTISGTIDSKTDLILTADNAAVTLIFTQSGWWII
jgi:hypothetical protein